MKKYVVGLFLLLAQNICAMETFILNGVRETDEKCKLVAKYLHKYPKGRASGIYYIESGTISNFFEDKDRIVLSHRVKKYMLVLKNAQKDTEGYEILQLLYGNKNFPADIKQIIFTKVLWSGAQQYYAIDNALKFVTKSPRFSPCCNYLGIDNRISRLFKPYFLSEICEDNQGDMQFFCDEIHINASSIDDVPNEASAKLQLIVPVKHAKKGMSVLCEFTVDILKNYIAFLDMKEQRVMQFKQFFNATIMHLSEIDDEKGIREFTSRLGYFKDLTKTTLSFYQGIMDTSRITFNDEKI